MPGNQQGYFICQLNMDKAAHKFRWMASCYHGVGRMMVVPVLAAVRLEAQYKSRLHRWLGKCYNMQIKAGNVICQRFIFEVCLNNSGMHIAHI